MRNEYDFTNPRKNPYASMLNKNTKLKPIPNFKDEASEKNFGKTLKLIRQNTLIYL